MRIIVQGYCTKRELWIGQEFTHNQKHEAEALRDGIVGDRSMLTIPMDRDYSFVPTQKMRQTEYFGLLGDWYND